MSLKSSEINNYSRNISAILISPFCSSSCSQACFPTIVRPIKYLWKLTLKIILNTPELNCSVFFSLYCLSVEEDGLLSSKSRTQRERRISLIDHEASLRTLQIARFRREDVLHDEGQLVVSYPKKFSQVSLSARVPQLHFSTLEKTKHGHNPILNNLLKTTRPMASSQ